VTTERQIVIAAELTTANGDMGLLESMIRAAQHELDASPTPGHGARRRRLLEHRAHRGADGRRDPTLVPPDARERGKPRPGRIGGIYRFMRTVLAAEHGHARYARRQGMIEPVFGDIKHNRRADRFQPESRRVARGSRR